MIDDEKEYDKAKYAAVIEWLDIDWQMEWDQSQYPDKPAIEPIFEEEMALSAMLARGIIICNDFWYEKDWPEAAKRKIALAVICNDVFAWGCADAENLDYNEIESLWQHVKQDDMHGHEVWCIKKRGQMPQAPVLKSIMARGIWDMDKLKVDLKVNFYDTASKMSSQARYEAYSDWCNKNNKTTLSFDKNWWEGWKEYVKENPEWSTYTWFKEYEAKFDAFKEEYNKAKLGGTT